MTSTIRYDRCLMVVDEHKDIWHGCNFFDGLLYYSEFKSVLKECYFTIADWPSTKIQLYLQAKTTLFYKYKNDKCLTEYILNLKLNKNILNPDSK